MMCAKSKAQLVLVALGGLALFPYLPKAMAGSATISESPSKAVVTGPTQSEDFITGGQWDVIVADGFYSMAAWPRIRHPLYSFNETDLQLGYMFPVWGNYFYRGNFEGLAHLFLWESTREHSGILGGGALDVHYNFVQPGWRLVPYIGASLGISGNDLYVQQSQNIIGGPFEFTLQGKVGARYFMNKNWGFLIEGGYQHVSNDDIYRRNVGVNQTGGRFGIFCTF
jgi:Lipid A 3-O-deacylase (PagL)